MDKETITETNCVFYDIVYGGGMTNRSAIQFHKITTYHSDMFDSLHRIHRQTHALIIF